MGGGGWGSGGDREWDRSVPGCGERADKMLARNPEHAIELLDRAFNEGDLATVLRYYEDAAVVIPKPGTGARGIGELRERYGRNEVKCRHVGVPWPAETCEGEPGPAL